MNNLTAATSSTVPATAGTGRFIEVAEPPVIHLLELPPTADELPYDDGEPMETQRHVWQMLLLIQALEYHWVNRQDFFVGGNMFLYYSLDQVRNRDFRGPDFFVVQGVERGERKSWVMWEEAKGPDLVIELLSDSTAERDKNEKMLIYQDRLRVPEYFLYDPFSGELSGYTLRDGKYQPVAPDAEGRFVSGQLGLSLARWRGKYQGIDTEWLRWATLDGQVLPVPEEIAEQEHGRAERLAARLRELGVDPDTLK